MNLPQVQENVISQHDVFAIRESALSWCLYAVLMCILTFATFGNLSTHLFHTHDQEYLQDTAASQGDFWFVVSPQRIYPGRPTFNLYLWAAYKLFKEEPAGYHLLQVWLHFLASLLVAFTFRRLGATFELSLIGGLLFLMNVAHFRAVHWISATSYILALVFGLGAVLLYHRGLEADRRVWTLAAALVLAAAVCAHPSAAIVALLCLFLALQRRLAIWRAAYACLPLFAAAFISGVVLTVVYSGAPQVEATLRAPEFLAVIRNLLWMGGRLITNAFWLPDFILLEEYTYWELAAGFLLLSGSLFLAVRKGSSLLFWTVWSVAFISAIHHISNPWQRVWTISISLSLVRRHLLHFRLGDSDADNSCKEEKQERVTGASRGHCVNHTGFQFLRTRQNRSHLTLSFWKDLLCPWRQATGFKAV